MVYAAYLFSGSSGVLTNPNRPDRANENDSLPEGTLVALAGGNYLATFAEGAPQLERQDEPFDTDQFLNAVYTRPSVNALNEPYAVVSAPELNTVYAAKLSASGGVNSYGTAFYAYRETGDGWFRWSEVAGWELQALEQASSAEEFRRVVTELNEQGGQSRQNALDEGRSTTPRPSDSADQALFAAALGGRAAVVLLDRHQHPEDTAPAASGPDAAPAQPEPELEPQLDAIDLDQPFFASIPNGQYQGENGEPSAVIAAGERVVAARRWGQVSAHDVPVGYTLTNMQSANNAFTSAAEWGSQDRRYEQPYVVVPGDNGTALRRTDANGGTIFEIFQPAIDQTTGQLATDPATGKPTGSWMRFTDAVDIRNKDMRQWYDWLGGNNGGISLHSANGMDTWAKEARRFLAGTLHEVDPSDESQGYTRDETHGHEHTLGLRGIPEEAKQELLAVALDSPEMVASLRQHLTEKRKTPDGQQRPPLRNGWGQEVRAERIAQEQQARQRPRRTAQEQWSTPGMWWEQGGGGPAM